MNISQSPPNYQRYAKSTVAIQILICLFLLILVIKEAINFYLKNYHLYTEIDGSIRDKDYRKEEENIQNILESTNHNVQLGPDKGVGMVREGRISPKEINLELKASKAPINRAQTEQDVDRIENKQNLQDNCLNSVAKKQTKQSTIQSIKPLSIPKGGWPQHSTTELKQSKSQNARTLTEPPLQPQLNSNSKLSFKLNLTIERVMLRLPIFAIMVINIVLLTSYQFLVIMSFCSIILMVLREVMRENWGKLAILIDVGVAGVTVAGFINGYVTTRIPMSP